MSKKSVPEMTSGAGGTSRRDVNGFACAARTMPSAISRKPAAARMVPQWELVPSRTRDKSPAAVKQADALSTHGCPEGCTPVPPPETDDWPT
jgi:hypothetical protein